ncbi:hypothetical protein BSKO_03275 [Bryopsis sp. KO-2023]|nr:hypothetical protein BSKO_03275 [Bryopsis sp. KO-2023]
MAGQDEASQCAYEKARKEIIARLGGGLVAERAAEEAIRQRAKKSRNVPVSYKDMFKFRGPVPEGLTADTPDLLEQDAVDMLPGKDGESSTQNQDDLHSDGAETPRHEDGYGNSKNSFEASFSQGSSPHHGAEGTRSSQEYGIEEGFEEISESEFRSEGATDQLSDISESEVGFEKGEDGSLFQEDRDSASEAQGTIKSYFDDGGENDLESQAGDDARAEGVEFRLESLIGEDAEQIAQHLNEMPEQSTPVARRRACPKSFLDSPGSKAYDLMGPISLSESPLKKGSKIRQGSGKRRPASAGFVSHSLGKLQKSTERADEYFNRYRVKQHKGSIPDFKFSQPRSAGPQETLKQARWSFDEAHPALAADHCLRSSKQNQMLEEERWQRALDRRQQMLKKEREASKKQFRGLKDYAGRRSRVEEKPVPTEDGGRCKSAPGFEDAEKMPTGNRSSAEKGGGGGNQDALGKLDLNEKLGASLEALRRPVQASESDISASDEGSSVEEEVKFPPRRKQAIASKPRKLQRPTWINQDPLVNFKKPKEEELRVALGSFDAEAYEVFSSEMDKTMEARSQVGRRSGNLESGYASDLERERKSEREKIEAAKKKITEDEKNRQLEDAMKDNWAEQNKWMDAYRHSVGGEGGYASDETPFDEQKEGLIEKLGSGEFSEEELQEFNFASKVMSATDRGLVKSCYIPIVSTTLGAAGMPRCGYQSDDGFSHVALREWRAEKYRPPDPTVPEPFEFEERAKDRPATIMEVKTQQDLEINRRELKALKGHAFKANPIPKSTSEPRFETMMAGQEFKRKMNHDHSMKVLSELEKPFSFYQRDREAALRKKKLKNDPNRFQKPFKAKDIPRHVTEDRYVLLKADLEGRKLVAKQRAAALLQESKMPPRMEDASKSPIKSKKSEKQNPLDPKWGKRYAAPPRLGQVPDFDMLHRDWDHRIAKAHAMTRKKMTVPEGFSFCSEDDGKHVEKAQNRQKKIMVDIVMDDELPEQRWPFVSNRKKVYPRPPPVFGEPDVRVSDTRTNKLRTMAIKKNRKKGKYASTEERDLIELHKSQKSAEARAKLYVKLQREQARHRNIESSTDIVQTSESRETTQSTSEESPNHQHNSSIQDRTDTPHQYIQARHDQAEQDAREIVEEVLLQQGLDVYRYVEEGSS